MDNTRAQQKAMDDELVTPANRLKIGKSNLRLSSNLKSKEPTLQVVLDALKLTPFYKAFEITADVLEIYMQEFWVTVSKHHSSLCFKLNGKSHTVNVDNFRDMLKICPKLPGAEPPKIKASVKKKQKKLPTQGLETLSKVALTEEEKMIIVTKRSLTQFYSSHASDSGADEGTGEEDDDEVGMNDDDDDNDDDDNNDDDDEDADNQDDGNQDDDNKQNDSDNDRDDFVHPKFSTHDQDERQDKEDSFDPRVQTPSHVESTDDEDSDEEIQGANVEGDKQDEEETNEEVEPNEFYRDVNINLVGRDTKMMDAPRIIIQNTQVIEDTHVIITLVNPEVPTPATVPSTSLQDLPNIGSLFGFDHRLKTLENDFLKFKQTNQFTEAISTIPGIVDAYLANKIHEAVKNVVQLQSDRLRDEAQAENEDFINKLDDNIKKIIKDQVKEQVKAQVSKILLKIEKTVNEQLEAEVLTRSSNESKTSHAVAANLSELELKKILIDKLEITFKRRRDDEDKDKEPFAGSNRGSKRRRAEKELESTTEEPMHTAKDLEEPAHQEFEIRVTEDQPDEETSQLPDCSLDQMKDPLELEYFLEEVYKATTDQLDWNNPKGQQYPHDLRKPLPLIPNSRGRQVIPFDHFINNDLAYLSGGVSSQKYTNSVMKTKAADYRHIKWIEDLVLNTTDDDKLYKFKEGDFKRLRIQDIEDMLLLLVQGKLTNLTVEERLAFNVSLQMFTRSIIIQRRVEDLQLAYSNPRGFIYQNKDKKYKLIRIDELHKFSDCTLNDVRTALDDRLKRIRIKYLPQTIWSQSDRDKAGAMIQAIDK
ncbi:hypothetical protein Tco_0003017 [Tanacetum coccineum]